MNDRFREIIAEAGLVYWPNKELDRVAELLVLECINVGRQAFLKDNSTVPVFPAKQIKQHFGVEQ